MRFEYDPEVDAAYVYLRDLPYAFGEELDHSRHIDYAADKQPIGIELLYVSDGVNLDDLPEQEAVARLLQEQQVKVFARSGKAPVLRGRATDG